MSFKLVGAPSGSTKLLEREDYQNLTIQQDISFDTGDWPEGGGREWIYAFGSTKDHYIPPRSEGRYRLRQGDALPVLRRNAKAWKCPDESHWQKIRGLLDISTSFKDLLLPENNRIAHITKMQVGIPEDDGPAEKCNMWGYWRYHWRRAVGLIPFNEDFYHGPLYWTANGIDNWHYNRIMTTLAGMVYLCTPEERVKAWDYFLLISVHHAHFGRYRDGVLRGSSRNEKGNSFIGDGNSFSWEKDFLPNLAASWLATDGHEMFDKPLREAAAFYASANVANIWQSMWGSRVPAVFIQNCIIIHMLLPVFRPLMEARIMEMLDQCGRFLDRKLWIWHNLGNGGTAEESPWMNIELVATIFRAWQHVPQLTGYAVSRFDLEAVASRIINGNGSTVRGDGHRFLKYRYGTTDVAPASMHLTSFAIPALKLLGWGDHPMVSSFQKFAGSSFVDIEADTPADLSTMGVRRPSEGWGWLKSIALYGDSQR